MFSRHLLKMFVVFYISFLLYSSFGTTIVYFIAYNLILYSLTDFSHIFIFRFLKYNVFLPDTFYIVLNFLKFRIVVLYISQLTLLIQCIFTYFDMPRFYVPHGLLMTMSQTVFILLFIYFQFSLIK